MKLRNGQTDEWYTPKYIFEALNIEFDLDPCHPLEKTFVPAKRWYTKNENGLHQVWHGLVLMNPPFGGRNGYFPWVEKFLEHGNGIGLFTSLTSSEGFQKYIPKMDAILFPKTKTIFIKPNGEEGGNPFHGVVLFSKGENATNALRYSGLGIFLEIQKTVNDNKF